ncbi:Cell division protein FtsQ [Bordetella sputigena]|uniref:SGNH/GDSL hydrolase family protein n=1 Tax=Bordetella sputigena TaxID=1416810 RepID=UPI0039F080C0
MLPAVLAGLSILIIGDSHMTVPTHLISTLHDDLVQQGAHVHSLGICGANAGDWTKVTTGTCGGAERIDKGQIKVLGANPQTTPIKQLIANDKPNIVMIVMGDTMAAYDKPDFPKTWVWQQVTALTGDIAATNTACIWIGPAWGSEGGKFGKTFARVKLMSSFLAANVAPCAYIDSLNFSKPGQWGTVDGQHFTAPGYKQWGDAITKAVLDLPMVKGMEKK